MRSSTASWGISGRYLTSGRARSRPILLRKAISWWSKGDNVTKTGDRYDNDYCMVWRVENGKITMIKEYCDTGLVERVLGPFPEEMARVPA